MTLASTMGSPLSSCAAWTFVLFQEGHTRLWPRTLSPLSRIQSTAAMVDGRDSTRDHWGHFISFSITAKLISCKISFISPGSQRSGAGWKAQSRSPLCRRRTRAYASGPQPRTANRPTGFVLHDDSEIARADFSIRASAALRQAVLSSLPGPSLVNGKSAAFLFVPYSRVRCRRSPRSALAFRE
jgi:hypothetical protein